MADHPQRRAGFWGAFRHAWDGLVWSVAHQRNMKVHVVAAVLVGLVGSALPLGLPEKVTLIFCVLLVFFAEIVNTALEALVDLHTEDFRSLARISKDAAAAGVLVLAIGTMAIFAAILVNDWPTIAAHPREVLRQVVVGVPLAGLGALLTARRRGGRALDAVLLVGTLALWGLTLTWTTSAVFSGMVLGLLVLQGAAARELRARPAKAAPLDERRSGRAAK
jgi:diacylglycerol kinase (ATP)